MAERQPMCWKVRFDQRRPLETLAVTGVGGEMLEAPSGKDVLIPLPYGRHTLLQARGSTATIFAGPAVLPVFARVRGDQVELSNRAAQLMVPGESIAVSTQVLVQQLLGANYPQYGMFRDIKFLEANAVYAPATGELRYQRTMLSSRDGADHREILRMICDGYEPVFVGGRPICVLVSGGYDSRFNLAIALHLAQRHGNQVHAFHEYKDEAEYAIARALAERARVPLHTETRQSFSALVQGQIFDDEFIRFHSGTYRDNIPRWRAYLTHILSLVDGGVVLGLGAEAHKGKFYGQVHHLREDGERVFGASLDRIDRSARALGFAEFDRDTQRNFFDGLRTRAEAFEDNFSRIDFLHYHTYVVNGYGHRCFDFQQFFDIPFPLLDQRFLTAIFAMPAEAKRDFRIVRDGIVQLAPQLAEIPFVSANAKALKSRRPGQRSIRERFPALGSLKDLLVRRQRKGKLSPTVAARIDSLRAGPGSEITDRLLRCLRHEVRADVRLDYALQAFLFFQMLEVERGVTLTCV